MPDFSRWLRRTSLRRALALIAAFSIFALSSAQAAHSHRSDSNPGSELHVECLLCMHADRLASAPDLPRSQAFSIAWSFIIADCSASNPCAEHGSFYNARAPPRR